jgi:hypothetical protein
MKSIFLLTLLLWMSPLGYSESSPFDRNAENTTLLNPACPATLTGVYADSSRHRQGRVSVHLINQTEKRLIAVKVGFDGRDAAWDNHEFPKNLCLGGKSKAGEGSEAHLARGGCNFRSQHRQRCTCLPFKTDVCRRLCMAG